jgi:hypothetical protein
MLCCCGRGASLEQKGKEEKTPVVEDAREMPVVEESKTAVCRLAKEHGLSKKPKDLVN